MARRRFSTDFKLEQSAGSGSGAVRFGGLQVARYWPTCITSLSKASAQLVWRHGTTTEQALTPEKRRIQEQVAQARCLER